MGRQQVLAEGVGIPVPSLPALLHYAAHTMFMNPGMGKNGLIRHERVKMSCTTRTTTKSCVNNHPEYTTHTMFMNPGVGKNWLIRHERVKRDGTTRTTTKTCVNSHQEYAAHTMFMNPGMGKNRLIRHERDKGTVPRELRQKAA